MLFLLHHFSMFPVWMSTEDYTVWAQMYHIYLNNVKFIVI